MFSAGSTQTAAVATGILDPTAGARAEAWPKWNSQGDGVGFLQDAIDQDFASRLAAGIRKKTVLT